MKGSFSEENHFKLRIKYKEFTLPTDGRTSREKGVISLIYSYWNSDPSHNGFQSTNVLVLSKSTHKPQWLTEFPCPYFPLLPSHKESDTPCFQLSQTPRKTASHVWSQDFLPLLLITWATECHPNILVFKTHPALPWNHSSNSDLHSFLRGSSKSLPDPSSWVSLLLSCFFSYLLQISHMKIWWFPSRSLSGVPQK